MQSRFLGVFLLVLSMALSASAQTPTADQLQALKDSLSPDQQSSILQKPFSSTSLADMIRSVLAGQAGEKAGDAKERRVIQETLRNS